VITGRYAWRSALKKGVLSGYSKALIDISRMTVASMLRSNGYHTGCVGKWHLGLNWTTTAEPEGYGAIGDTSAAFQGADEFSMPAGLEVDYRRPVKVGPADYGFDYSYIIPASLDMAPYVYVENNMPVSPADQYEPGRNEGAVFWRPGEAMAGFDFLEVLPHLTDKAVGFIDDHAAQKPGQPFFLYFPLPAPHWPWMPTEDVVGSSGAGKYGDFTHLVDRMVGRVMQAVERSGMAENTLFIFTSDNGAEWDASHIAEFGHYANHPDLRGKKRDIWEGGHRMPFIVRWPERVAAGSTSDQTICLTDLLATAADIIGEELPANGAEDSFSILPALLGVDDKPLREATVHHSVDGTFAIRQGDWKLIRGQGPGSNQWDGPEPGDPPGQLYNLADDIGETKNLYNERPEIVAQLSALLDSYLPERSRRDD
jgi:arylsulfatase A-like enzyme